MKTAVVVAAILLSSCSPQSSLLSRICTLEMQLEEATRLNAALIECALAERAAKEECESKLWRP